MNARSLVPRIVGVAILCMGLCTSRVAAQPASPDPQNPAGDPSMGPMHPPEHWDRSAPVGHASYPEAALTAPRRADANLLENGSFEQGNTLPSGWHCYSWNPSHSAFSLDHSQAIAGTSSVRIESTLPDDAHCTQTVAVLRGADYRLTGWVKTENVAHTAESVDAGANLSLFNTWTRSPGLLGGNDWTLVTLLFNSGWQNQVTVAVRLGFWSGATTGVAYFDDIRLELLSAPATEIRDPGFESEATSPPDFWRTKTVEGAMTYAWGDSNAHSGSSSAKVSSAQPGIGRWTQAVLVDPDSEYELAGWIKTQDVVDPSGESWIGGGAKLGVYGVGSYLAAATPGLCDTHDWVYVSTRFITGKATLVEVVCTLGDSDGLYVSDKSMGSMWCDDLVLTKIRALDRTYLSGRRLALDVYAQDYASFDDPGLYVSHLDEIYEALADLVNGVPYDGGLIKVRTDASMYYAAFSGNPIRIPPGPTWPEQVNAHGMDPWVPHELGHDFDIWPQSGYYVGQMAFDGVEAWANFKMFYAFDVLGALHPHLTVDLWGQTTPLSAAGQRIIDRYAQPWIASGRSDYYNMSYAAYDGMLYSLVLQVGWEPFKEVFQEYSQSTMAVPPSDEAKIELLANRLSLYAGVDLVPTFQSWRFPVRRYGEAVLSVDAADDDIVLSWTPPDSMIDHHEVFRSAVDPYFDLGSPDAQGMGDVASNPGSCVTYVDEDVLGSSAAQYFYQVWAVYGGGLTYPISEPVGVFIVELAPGGP